MVPECQFVAGGQLPAQITQGRSEAGAGGLVQLLQTSRATPGSSGLVDLG